MLQKYILEHSYTSSVINKNVINAQGIRWFAFKNIENFCLFSSVILTVIATRPKQDKFLSLKSFSYKPLSELKTV